jgi:AraC-like DNA-binding protein
VQHFILNILAGAALFQLAFFSAFLLTQKTENPLTNRILSAFLFAKAACLVNLLSFLMFDEVLRVFPHLFLVGSSFTVLWGPLLYLYALSITHPKFRWRPVHAAHFIPFFAHLTLITFRYHRFDAESKRLLIQNGLVLSRGEEMAVAAVIQGLIVLYTIASLVLLFRYRAEIKSSMSTVERYNLTWLTIVIFGFLAKTGFDVGYYVVTYATGKASTILLIGSMTTLLIFIQILVLQSLRQPAILFGLEKTPKYRDSILTEAQKHKYLSMLETVMAEQKPYLDPMLTLPALGRKTHIPPRHLSQILNENLNQNFFDYINTHRIEESKRLLRENAPPKRTVFEILLEVGFNSKSSFNSAFKRYTGMTPTSFIRSA